MILKIGAKGTKIRRGETEKIRWFMVKYYFAGSVTFSTGFTSLKGLKR